MKKLILFAAALSLAAAPAFAQDRLQREDGVWHVRGDDGEIVHVMASPELARSAELGRGHMVDMAQSPNRLNGYSVFNASYGTIPGQLDDHGGTVVSNAAFQPIFYNAATAASLQSGIDNMVNNLSGSDPGMKVITQYSKSGNAISATLTHTADFVDNKTAPSRISDSGVRTYLTGLFNAHSITANGNTIYGVYLPSGTVSTNGSSRSCTSYCGYHSSYTYNGITVLYAVLPYNNCSGCSLSGKTVVDMMTIVSGHEIREAITDPVNAWWESSSGYEADDKCAWHNLYQQAGGAWMQPEYSTGLGGFAKGCITP